MSAPATEIIKTAKPEPLREIVKWILAGNSERDVIDAIGQQWPDVAARPLILKALKEISKAGEPDEQLVAGFVIEGTRQIYQRALDVGDLQTALRALKQLADFAGR
jgi:hypothetical protein